jgi:hypothetical protein
MPRAQTITSTASRWWGWGIGVLLVVGGILLVIALFGEAVEREAGNEVAVAPKPVAVDRVHRVDEAMLFGARDPALAGTEVDLSDLRVTRVLGERVFYVARVGDAIGRQFPVYLADSGAGPAIEPGIQLSALTGEVRAVARADLERWALAPEETERLRDSAVYLHADAVTIAGRR